MAISRLDTATPEINLQAFSLQAITRQLQIEFEPIAKSEGIELKFVHSTKWVYSDQALLRRLLQNLVSNAIKFTQSGTVLVGAKRTGNQISLAVHDTGVGISEEEQSKIFVEFARLNNMPNQVPGLGLGLSIVERIANMLELEVGINSTLKKGTSFNILMDIVEAEKVSEPITEVQAKRKPGQLTGMSVLCIDNEEAILLGMRSLLEEWGCSVLTAKTLEEANTHIQGSNGLPDIILADYHLDHTTGIEVYDKLVQDTNHTIPAVLITADRSEEVKRLAIKSDITVLNKPIRPAALRALISQHKKRLMAAE